MTKKLSFAILSLFFCLSAYSQTDISLYEQFNGRYDFTYVGNTLNTKENGVTVVDGQDDYSCDILTSSSANLNLAGGNNILKAYLYWAGSGTGDFNIKLNGQDVAAQRTFSATYTPAEQFVVGGPVFYIDRYFFSAFADVTNLVQATGNGTYTLSEMDMTDVINGDGTNVGYQNNIYCRRGLNFGGWAIVIVYENSNLPLNQLNLYDGLQYIPPALNITLPSLNVTDNEGARIGFVAWEGDAGLAVTETLKINGNTLSNPPLNPSDNAFNGTNSVTGSDTLYNMDLDIYDIQNYIAVGDETASIQLTSGQDFVMVNAIMTKLNSLLPDATITVENIAKECNSRTLQIDYTVHNVNSTDALPAGTTVGIYVNGDLLATTVTTTEIPIGGSESGTITLTIPDSYPGDIELLFIVDYSFVITETDETNNALTINENLWLLTAPTPQDIAGCEIPGNNYGIFDFSGYTESLKQHPTDTVTFYTSLADAQVPQNEIGNPANYPATANPQEIYVRLQDANGCVMFGSFTLITNNCLYPDATITAGNIAQACDSRTITVTYTVSNINAFDVLPANTPVGIYVNDVLLTTANTAAAIPIGSSLTANVTLTIPADVPLTFNMVFKVDDGNTVTELIENNNTFTLPVSLWISPVLQQQPQNLTECETFNGSGVGSFNFSAYAQSLKNVPTDIITFHTSQQDANSGAGAINPAGYLAAPNTIIYVRLQDEHGCYDTAFFTLLIKDCYFPDATVVIEEVYKQCNSRIIHVHYTVSNFNGTDVLPAETPVSIYVNGEYLDFTETLEDIAIGESESNYITLTIPVGIPLDFDLTFVADDTGDGTGIVIETDETNNGNTLPATLVLSPVLLQPADITSCDKGLGIGTFDFSGYANSLKNYDNETVTFYTSQQGADQDLARIYNTTAFVTTENPQRVYVRLDNGTCHTTASFLLYTKKCAPVTFNYVTPNNDGRNDSFYVEGLRNIFLNFKMSIYNRWGNLIWTGNNNTADWNGIADVEKAGPEGTTVPTGTYYFVLELNDPDYPDPIVGWVYVTL